MGDIKSIKLYEFKKWETSLTFKKINSAFSELFLLVMLYSYRTIEQQLEFPYFHVPTHSMLPHW